MKQFAQNKDFDATWRYERKGIIEAHKYKQFMDMLKTKKLCFDEAFPDRVINNLYSDTVHLSHYLDHVNGSRARQKMRIRWYGDLEQALKPVLEFKVKDANVGNKLKYRLNSFDFGSRFGRRDIDALIATSLGSGDPAIKYCKRFLPTLINSYTRSYFVSRHHGIRVTVDRNLKFSKFSMLGCHQKLRGLMEPVCIIEIKYDRDTLAKEYNLEGLFMNHLQKYSKYIGGMQSAFHLDEY